MAGNKTEFDIIEFATQASKVIEKNFKLILGIFILLVVGGSVLSIMNSAEITKVYQKKKADFLEAKAEKEKKVDPKAPTPKPEEKKDLVEASGVLEKDYPEIPGQLASFLRNWQNFASF